MVIRFNIFTELVTKKNITFGSYNVKNFNLVKYKTISDLFEKCSFMLLQETWLKEQVFIDKFKNDFPNSECISASKMENKEITAGRKYGGVGICYHTNIKCASQSIFIFKNSFFSKSDGLTFQPDMIYFNLKYIGRNLGAGMLVALTIESI